MLDLQSFTSLNEFGYFLFFESRLYVRWWENTVKSRRDGLCQARKMIVIVAEVYQLKRKGISRKNHSL